MWQDNLQPLREKHIHTPRRFLTRQEVRTFYDRFGRKQDKQYWYESPATQHLIKHGGFKTAMVVFELGCGTGAFAEEILAHSLPKTERYCGVDISSTMVELTRKRLERFGSRVEVLLTNDALKFDLPDTSVDRFVTNYVLDLLSPDDIRQVLTEAYRLLKPEGRLCVVSLTCGRKGIARLITWLWSTVHWLVTTIKQFAHIGAGTLAPWDSTQKLVVQGVYCYVRNPMISGVVFILIGETVLFGSLLLLGWCLLFVIANAVYIPLCEERGLTERFGEAYRVYKQHVPRWIPRVTPWKPTSDVTQ